MIAAGVYEEDKEKEEPIGRDLKDIEDDDK